MKKFSRMPKSDGTGGSPGGIGGGGAPAAGGVGIGGVGGSVSLSVGSSRVFAVGRFQVTVEEVLAEGERGRLYPPPPGPEEKKKPDAASLSSHPRFFLPTRINSRL